jgi:hypothetical protein
MNVASALQSLKQLVEPSDEVKSKLSFEHLAGAVWSSLQLEPSTVPPVIDPILSLELRFY